MTTGLFRSSGYLSQSQLATASAGLLDVACLPPFLRTLLVTDGTVTKSLEAWFWEPVQVELLAQQTLAAREGVGAADDLAAGALLSRQVVLKGRFSERIFALADSRIVLDALPPALASELLQGQIGIGEILRRAGVETFRDLVEIDYCENTPLPLQAPDGPYLMRRYVIELGCKAAISVSEYFPLPLYRG